MTTTTLHWKYVDAASVPLTGTLTFQYSQAYADGLGIVPPASISVPASDGKVTLQVAPLPLIVRESIDGLPEARYAIWLDGTKADQALADLGRSCVPDYPRGCGCCLHGGGKLLGFTVASGDLRWAKTVTAFTPQVYLAGSMVTFPDAAHPGQVQVWYTPVDTKKTDTPPNAPWQLASPHVVPGPVGPMGPAGAVGPAGPAGATGPAGPAGAAGPAGPAGPAGAPGKDGTGVSIVGTTPATAPTAPQPGQMWIVSTPPPAWVPAGAQPGHGLIFTGGAWQSVGPIQGPAGPAGAQGPAGVAGPAGAVGPQGPQGPAGAAGPQGVQGVQGNPGPTAVSADAGNIATLGTDGLISVPLVSGSGTLPPYQGGSGTATISFGTPVILMGLHLWTANVFGGSFNPDGLVYRIAPDAWPKATSVEVHWTYNRTANTNADWLEFRWVGIDGKVLP